MLIDNTNWDYIYGPKNMSMMQAISYIQQERQQFISSAKSIAEYASDECEKEWGITGRFNTAMGESERRNPLITGINEFFEEENIARREHMTANVAEPQKLMREANRCKRGAGILVTRMLAMIRRKYPRFDFSFYY
ncbi:MAG: hypothetical protein M1285_05670 [Candidatus Thermoplasmatota archaeon]|nr:hypothetical protein [Candidatus Thermoplasmatota archaeon]